MSNAKRINPSAATLRELYILSGNRCAFPDCNHEIIDEKGTLVAQLCHIEAAMPGGERFNTEMTDKERAQASNLLFMCHKHHKITDNVSEFDVAKMKKIKHDHEKLYRNIMHDMVKTIEDVTKKQILNKSKHFQSLNRVLDWNLREDDLKETVDSCNNEFKILKQLNKSTRAIFSSIIERSEHGYRSKRIILLSLIQKNFSLSDNDMKDYLDILIKYKLISEPYIDDDYRGAISEIREPDGWDMWGDIKKYCELQNIALEEIIVDLDFEKLD
ncbi:hypothetical protein HAU06_20575 [Bacillus toyonensis]|uniref:hypothetical protein n=1 Tax=Bacillus toyonensis TaxID=155322 RepID=UPI00163A0B35|nr:hypothetical protein [Bacillus toyonensis]MBC2686473.1 hypothetical protein [Bacillus toyonensis]